MNAQIGGMAVSQPERIDRPKERPADRPIDPTNEPILRMITKRYDALSNVHQRNVLPTRSTVQERRPLRLNKSKAPSSYGIDIDRYRQEKTTWKVPWR